MRRELFQALRPLPDGCKAGLGMAMFFAFVVQALSLALPLIVRWAIRAAQAASAAETRNLLLTIGALLASVAIVRGAARWAQRLAAAKAASRILASLRERMFSHLQRLSLGHLVRKDPGRVLVRFIGDANSLRAWLARTIVSVPADVLAIMMSFAILCYLGTALAFAFAVPLILIVPVVLAVNPRARTVTGAARREQSRLCAALNVLLPDMRWVKAAGLENETGGHIGRKVQEIAQLRIRRARYDATLEGTAYAMSTCGVAAVVFVGLWLLTTRSLEHGDLLAAVWLSLHARAPANRLFKANVIHQRAMVALDRINALMQREPERGWASDLAPYNGEGRTVEFQNVGYRTASGRWALEGFNASLHAPGLIQLEGPGAGHYLFDLLLRLRRPHRGRIYLDGRDIRGLRVTDIRRRIGLIDGRRTESPKLADRLMLSCQDTSFVRRLAQSWEAAEPLAPGVELSTVRDSLADPVRPGSRTVELPVIVALRLGCALALVDNPPLLLIEEPFRHLSAEQRETVAQWISDLSRQRLVLVSTRVTVEGWQTDCLSVDPHERARGQAGPDRMAGRAAAGHNGRIVTTAEGTSHIPSAFPVREDL